jgi:hypothetical protein
MQDLGGGRSVACHLYDAASTSSAGMRSIPIASAA